MLEKIYEKIWILQNSLSILIIKTNISFWIFFFWEQTWDLDLTEVLIFNF